MNRTRILIALGVIVLIAAIVLGIDFWRRSRVVELEPGSVPIYLDGRLIGGFLPTDLEKLEQVSFVDQEEGKTQEGWRLRDVLLLYIQENDLPPDAAVVVSSSSRDKSADLTWSEVETEENMVMFDLSSKGTLKLVSKLERLDTRDEWVQDVDRIEITRP